jgi:hypothetical protein
MDIVYRIYDNILASGVEAVFAFSLVLLHKNEETLLALKFDEILSFLNNRLFEVYEVRPLLARLLAGFDVLGRNARR